jgi:hypothetical protein
VSTRLESIDRAHSQFTEHRIFLFPWRQRASSSCLTISPLDHADQAETVVIWRRNMSTDMTQADSAADFRPLTDVEVHDVSGGWGFWNITAIATGLAIGAILGASKYGKWL